jgi:prolipoprotein diacylglyceryltransferase
MANSIKNLFKTGFGIGLGVYTAQLVFVVLGMILFFPGYFMYQQKTREKAENSEKFFAFILMAIGVILMGGAGFYLLLESAADLLD